MENFARFLERLQSYSSRPCIDCGGVTVTYSQLLAGMQAWQVRFDQFHADPGTVVGLRTDYSLSAVAALLGLLDRGSVAALIPRDRDATQYAIDARVAAILDLDVNGAHEWRHIAQPASHPLIDQLRAAGHSGIVMFTSGSSGRPKAALQSTERFFRKFLKPGRQLRTLAFLMFDHVAGLDTLFYTLSNGGTLILTHRRDPESILRLIESHNIEALPTSPSFLRMLCAAGNARAYDLSSLKVITYGSEPMDPSTLARLNRWIPAVQISQKYGTTETGSPRSVSRGTDSLWLQFKNDGIQTKVVDGVLWIRSESTILGYLNAPSPVDTEGWYCTNDLVDVDGEWIRFRGRASDIINVGGEKVSPMEVEQSILELDFVRDAVVAGDAHPLMGQVVTAEVVLSTANIDSKEAVKRIRQHCRQRLPPYSVPVKIAITIRNLANDRLKVQRRRSLE